MRNEVTLSLKRMPLVELVGDATNPQAPTPWIIAHICNDVGKWGRGFVVPLAARWPAAKSAYLMAAQSSGLTLGQTIFVTVGAGMMVANMVAQRGVMRAGRRDAPLRYDALADSLAQVGRQALRDRASIHMPRIGTGLAGGTWDRVAAVLREATDLDRLDVYVYDLPK